MTYYDKLGFDLSENDEIIFSEKSNKNILIGKIYLLNINNVFIKTINKTYIRRYDQIIKIKKGIL